MIVLYDYLHNVAHNDEIDEEVNIPEAERKRFFLYYICRNIDVASITNIGFFTSFRMTFK